MVHGLLRTRVLTRLSLVVPALIGALLCVAPPVFAQQDSGGSGGGEQQQTSGEAQDGQRGQQEQGQQQAGEGQDGAGLTKDPEQVGEALLEAAGVENAEGGQDGIGGGEGGEGGVLPDLSNMSAEEAVARLGPWLISIAWDVLAVIGIFIAAFLLGGWLRSITKKGLVKARIETTIAQFAGNAIRWVVLAVGVLMALAQFGINITSLAALLGAGALAIGLAFQGALSNIAAGVMLAIFRPFRVGEWVEVDGEVGVVTDIDLFYTHIDKFDNVHVILPNSSVLGAKVESLTYNPTRRVEAPVGVAYGSDLRAAKEALEKAARDPEEADPERDPLVILTGYGDSSINWDVRVWGKSDKFLALRHQVVMAINDRLEEAGITIPFPQRDLNTNQPLRVHLERADADGRDASGRASGDGRAGVGVRETEDAEGRGESANGD